MITRSKLVLSLTVILATLAWLSKPSYAYIDPGTGSYIFQVLIASAVAALFTLKTMWGRIRSGILRIFGKNPTHDH